MGEMDWAEHVQNDVHLNVHKHDKGNFYSPLHKLY